MCFYMTKLYKKFFRSFMKTELPTKFFIIQNTKNTDFEPKYCLANGLSLLISMIPFDPPSLNQHRGLLS
jgi:hypothetical protein